MPFDFYRHLYPDPASDRMSTAGIQYSPPFLVTLPLQLVQSLVKRPNAGLCQINRLRKHHNEIRPLITNHSPGDAVNADIAVNGKRRTPSANLSDEASRSFRRRGEVGTRSEFLPAPPNSAI
jgi:hypothetical protein